MVSRKKIEQHLPTFFIDGPTNGSDKEYGRIRRKLSSNPVERKRLVDRIYYACVDFGNANVNFDIFYDPKHGFDLKPVKRRQKA